VSRQFLKKINLWLLALCLSTLAATAFSQDAWNLELPLPSDDARWQEVKALWDDHWDGKNIDRIIDLLHELEKTGADPMAVSLWLSQSYYLKGRYQKDGRVENWKRSEAYASRAVSLDDDNMTAMKLLITSVSSYADLDYIKNTYGALWTSKLPVPVGRALPVPDDIPEFKDALVVWDQREDIEKGKTAVLMFKKIAEAHPDHLIAQTWVSRGSYYLGYYYLSFGQNETSQPFFREGNVYGLKALSLDQHYVPANYWRQLNLARSIQNANIVVKASYMNAIMDHLVLTANENATYFYSGPLISTATIIEKGGWLAEKGLGLAGYTIETVAMGLELATIAFPTYFYTHFAKAEVLFHMGRKEEAAALLHAILKMDPRQNPFHAPENICVQRLAGAFLKEHFPE
jgi:tetratricopeptide (TPR) repeat protein